MAAGGDERQSEATADRADESRTTTESKQTDRLGDSGRRNTCTVDLDAHPCHPTHLQEERDPGGFAAAASDRLQEPAAGHHLPADGVHAGPRQRLLEHGLHGQRAQASLRPESSIKQVRTLMSRRAAAGLARRLRPGEFHRRRWRCCFLQLRLRPGSNADGNTARGEYFIPRNRSVISCNNEAGSAQRSNGGRR